MAAMSCEHTSAPETPRSVLGPPDDERRPVMPEADSPGPLLGDVEPTAERVATARRFLQMHPRVFVPEPACQWCLKRYPCPDAAWAIRVLRRAQLERGTEP